MQSPGSPSVQHYKHPTEGFYGQSVAEMGLALTLCGLRRIPQPTTNITTDQRDWGYSPPERIGRPGMRSYIYGDDNRFANAAQRRAHPTGQRALPGEAA